MAPLRSPGPADVIDIVFIQGLPTPDDTRIAQWLAELPDDYRQRLARLRIRKRLLQSLLGLQLVRQLARARGIDDFRLDRIKTTPLGKPYADDLGEFSISHDEELVACAFADDGRVGLDVELIRDINIGHFARVFRAAERDWIGSDRERFFDLWTRKEAAVKVSGEHGIGHLQAVELDGDRTELDGVPLYLRPLRLAAGYAACVASDVRIDRIDIRRLVATPDGWNDADLAPSASRRQSG